MPYNFLMNTEGDIFAEHARFSDQWKQGLSRNYIEEKKKTCIQQEQQEQKILQSYLEQRRLLKYVL